MACFNCLDHGYYVQTVNGTSIVECEHCEKLASGEIAETFTRELEQCDPYAVSVAESLIEQVTHLDAAQWISSLDDDRMDRVLGEANDDDDVQLAQDLVVARIYSNEIWRWKYGV